MFTFTVMFVIINLFFLSVGALLYIYANKNGIAVPLMQLHKSHVQIISFLRLH